MSTATLTAPSVLLVNDLLTGAEWGAAQTRELLALAADVKAHPERYATTLRGKTLAMVFQKPSLRTRITFETGMAQLGGHAIYLAPGDIGIGDRGGNAIGGHQGRPFSGNNRRRIIRSGAAGRKRGVRSPSIRQEFARGDAANRKIDEADVGAGNPVRQS